MQEQEKDKKLANLQTIVVEQQLQLERKNDEIKDMNETYMEFKKESEEMEELLKKQVTLFEEQLSAQELQRIDGEAKYLEQLVNIKTKNVELQNQKDSLIENLKAEIDILKMQLIEAGVDVINKQPEDLKKIDNLEVSKENVQRLNLENENNTKIISELKDDIDKNKNVLRDQMRLFQGLSKQMDSEKELKDKDFQEYKKEKEEEIQILNQMLEDKDHLIKNLKKLADLATKQTFLKNLDNSKQEGEGKNEVQEKNEEDEDNEEEVQQLRELVVVQGNKLKQLSKDYMEYRDGSEKLLTYEKLVRDKQILELQVQLDKIEAQQN